MEEVKDVKILFKMSEKEHGILKQRMEIMGVKNRSAFIRRMSMYGYIIQIDLDQLKESMKLMRSISNNINQIAKRVNSTGNIYEADIEEIKEKYKVLRNELTTTILKISSQGI